MKKIAAALFLAVSAGSTFGQCNVTKYGIPDFDQRRNALDDNGSFHCVPTACINIMGYIANRGRPAALGHSSPNWADSGEYSFVTGRIDQMGGMMSTGGVFGTGTDMDGALSGLEEYIEEHNVGNFIIVGHIGDEDWQVRPFMMYDDLAEGFLVALVYGKYELDGDQWERVGGHCMTLCAMRDACNSTQCEIGFKDPWTKSDDSINSQSTFKTGWWDITRQVRNYDGDAYPMWGPADQDDGPNDKIRCIDKFITIAPCFALTSDFNFGNFIKHSAILLNNDDHAPTNTVNIPNNAALISAYIDPRSLNPIVLSAPVGGLHAKLWDYSAAQSSFTEVMDLPTTPGAFTIDRRGDLLLVISGDLHKYRYCSDGSVRLLATANVGTAMESIAVDDKTDDVYALLASPRRLLKFPGGDLTLDPYNGPLPANLPLSTLPCVAINPADGKPWVTSEGSTSLYQLTPLATAPGWSITGSVQTGIHKPTSLQFGDRGDMKFIAGGKIREYDLDPASGRYVPTTDPLFDNQPATGFLALARSRTNFDPRVHTGPAWADILESDDNPETEDCPADFNVDGFVDGIDYDEFNNFFERGHMNADVNFDGFVDGIDSDEFNNWFERGC